MGKKKPTQVVLERRKKVWELRQKFYTYEAIAAEMGISKQAVGQLLSRITKNYAKRHIEDIDRIKAEQVAELEHLAFEAYQAWEKSKKPYRIMKKENAFANGTILDVGKQVVESRESTGDPRYLEMARKCKADVREIVGANSPIKVDARFADLQGLTDEELKKRALEAIYGEGEIGSDAHHLNDGAEKEEMEPITRTTDASVPQ